MTVVRASQALPSSLRAALASGTTIVTPNKRLARRLAAINDDAQRASGRAVWPAPMVVPWASWLERLWLDVLASDANVAVPRRFTAVQGAYAWKEIVASGGRRLIDENGTAVLAADAWSLVHAWGTGVPSWRGWAGGDDDCATFAGWADDYLHLLAGAGAMDTAQLPDWLACQSAAVATWRSGSVMLAGFVEMSAQQERLVAALATAGMTIAHCTTVRDRAGQTSRVAGTSPRDELSRALHWAREHALADPGAAIGIAIEDFASRRDEVRALAEDILCPELQWPGREGADRPYNLSLGIAASEVPIIATALDLIGLAHGSLPMPRAAALMRSPFLAASPGDGLRRAALESTWLREGRRDISIDEVVAALTGVDRAFADRWRKARDEQRRPSNATPREWTEFWRAWLAAAGWPGDRALSSAEWQARGAWDDLLAQFAALGAVAKRIPARDSVATLAAAARDHVFQPESARTSIEIMGVLEATGLPLDALWIAGLAAEVWPPAPRPNPLLPISWQRDRKVPRSSAARELAYSRVLTAQWTHGASEVVLSYASRVDDHARSMSPLVPAAPWRSGPSLLPATTAQAQFASAPALERISDDCMPSLPPGSTASGGASLIETQSDCPFRASARFRLKVDAWPEPAAGLSAMERGILVHAAFAAFWRTVGDHAALVKLAPDALGARVDAAALAAMGELPAARWRRIAAAVRSGEAARVASIVLAWIDGFERSRPPFSIEAIEASRSLALGGLEFELRLDRIDALADGGTAIVDYKTGLAKAPARWFDPRPQGPQIGLYVLAQQAFAPDRPVRAAAYAQLKPGEFRIQGIAADAKAWPQLVAPSAIRDPDLPDWSAIVAQWSRSLGAIATEVREGHASVTPRDIRKTCRYCGLQPFCRIGALNEGDESVGDDA
ncbi:MAG: PD-(D/E)XK nuclease family protein [Betaproteobacteria bacterium]